MMAERLMAAELPSTLTPAELDEAQRAGVVKLLDVRTPAEFASAHVPGSYNMPLDRLTKHGAEFGTAVGPLVLICRSGTRAQQAEQLLQGEGLPRLHVLDGGILAWERAGLPVTRGRQVWSIERQIRAIAGGLVLLGTLGGILLWPPLLSLAAFVGAGLLFAGVTDTCMMGLLLARLPWNQTARCDVGRVLAELQGREVDVTRA